MAGPRRLNGALLLAVLLLTPACAAIVAGDGFDAEDRLVRATPSSSSGRVPSSKRPPSFEFSDLPARSLRRTPSQDSAFTGTAEQSDDHLDASRAEDELDASRDEDEPVSSESDAHFEKTLAAQIEKALDKEFDRADEEQSGVLGEGAGRSFNETKAAGQLETVVRVSRTGGGVVHEVVERDGDLGGGFRDGRGNATGAEDRRSESLFERLESSAKNIDRALGGKEVDEDVERLVDSRDNEFVISNPKSGTMELQQDLRLISDLVIILVASAAGAMVFTLMGQPLITGYLIAGSLVGPGGFGLVVELVQVETLAQFGIIFLLFALGVEFSFAQLREGKLDAEREEQEDDPELRERLHLHEFHDEPEAAGPDERAGDEVPGDQRLAHQREHHRARRGRDQNDHQVADQTQVLLQLHSARLWVGDDKLVVTGVHQALDVFLRVLTPERAVDILRPRFQSLEKRLLMAVFVAGGVPTPVIEATAEIAVPLYHLVRDDPVRPADAHDRLQLTGSLGLVERPACALAQDTALLLIRLVELFVQRLFYLRRDRLLEVRVRLRGHGRVVRAQSDQSVIALFRGAGETRILRPRSTKGTRRRVRELERQRSFRRGNAFRRRRWGGTHQAVLGVDLASGDASDVRGGQQQHREHEHPAQTA